jgi:hypothetical protein
VEHRREVEPAAFDLDAQRHVEPAARLVVLDVHVPVGGHQHPVAEIGRAVDAPAGLAQGRRGEGEEVGPVGFALEAVHAVRARPGVTSQAGLTGWKPAARRPARRWPRRVALDAHRAAVGQGVTSWVEPGSKRASP